MNFYLVRVHAICVLNKSVQSSTCQCYQISCPKPWTDLCNRLHITLSRYILTRTFKVTTWRSNYSKRRSPSSFHIQRHLKCPNNYQHMHWVLKQWFFIWCHYLSFRVRGYLLFTFVQLKRLFFKNCFPVFQWHVYNPEATYLKDYWNCLIFDYLH